MVDDDDDDPQGCRSRTATGHHHPATPHLRERNQASDSSAMVTVLPTGRVVRALARAGSETLPTPPCVCCTARTGSGCSRGSKRHPCSTG
jgi:hypothetical protein